MHVDAHRATVDQDLGGAVLVRALEDPVGVRRRAELVDLLLQELDLLLRFLEHADEPLVLALGVGELLARELVAAPQRLELGEHAIEAAAELRGVGAEEAQRVLQILDLVLRRPSRGRDRGSDPAAPACARPTRRCAASRRGRSPSCPSPSRTRSSRHLLVQPAGRAGGHASSERELQGSCHARTSRPGCVRELRRTRAKSPAPGIRRTGRRRCNPAACHALAARARPRERRGLACSAPARARHLDSPRPADPTPGSCGAKFQRPQAGGPKTRRTSRNIAAFSVSRVYQTDPLCQAAARGSSRRKPWNPRRSRALPPARRRRADTRGWRSAERPARSRSAPPRSAPARLRIPCRPAMRCCVGSCRNFDACVGRPPTRPTNRGAPPNFAAPGPARNASPCFGQSAAGPGRPRSGRPAAAACELDHADALGRARSETAASAGRRLLRMPLKAICVTLPSRSITVVSSSSPVAGSLRTRSFS